MRGEYWLPSGGMAVNLELPPRARRIRLMASHSSLKIGTTSACAENTLHHLHRGGLRWNYLRVRGEYLTSILILARPPELPPRARRILYKSFLRLQNEGTTSACAENTHGYRGVILFSRNYLRVRGEYGAIFRVSLIEKELPPRARRIPLDADQ